MQAKEKKVRCTNVQKNLLIEYMYSHPEFANLGTLVSTPGRAAYEAKWATLKQFLSDYGPDKTVEAWKTTWKDLKKKARKSTKPPCPSEGRFQVSLIDDSDRKLLSLLDEASSPGMSPSESSISNDVDDLPKFITEQTFENKEADPTDPLFVEKESAPKPGLDASVKRLEAENSRAKDTENLPKFKTEAVSESTKTDPLSLETTGGSKRELEKKDASRKRARAERSVFSYVKKTVSRPTKIIRIEIHDADNFPNAAHSMCNCQAEVCVQYVVKGKQFQDDEVYSNTMEIISKIQEDLEIGLIET